MYSRHHCIIAHVLTLFAGVLLPGYTGFIPESDHNALACYEASAVQQPRQDGKAASMLFTLDQYSRQRVPLYTGHRPTALSNLAVEEPAHGPTLQTTQVLPQPLPCFVLPACLQAQAHHWHMELSLVNTVCCLWLTG